MEKCKSVATGRFGEIEFDEESSYKFPEGLPGFEKFTRFAIVTVERYIPFQWLQSLDEPNLSFLIIRPSIFYPEYAPKISHFELSAINLRRIEDADIYSITTIGDEPEAVTANLRAPLLFNGKDKLAKQCILAEDKYLLKYPVLQSNNSQKPGKVELCLFSRGE